MEAVGIIRRSSSHWSSPLHVVPKPSGGWCPCGDYHRLNTVTVEDSYPVPRLQDFAATMAGKTIFSKIDLIRAYHQVPMTPNDIPKTAVTTPFGLYEFLRMPFGLKNTAQAFHRLDKVCQGLARVFVYLDDILVASEDRHQHLRDLTELFGRLKTPASSSNAPSVFSVSRPLISSATTSMPKALYLFLRKFAPSDNFRGRLQSKAPQVFLGLIYF